MTADVVIKGGMVLDGTGNPGVIADVAVSEGRISQIGDRPRRRADARRRRSRRRARVHRHPHPLRRAGLLGPGAHPVVLPRGHHRRRGQLRVLDRADPARAPRADRAHARERRGHERRVARRRASRGTSRPSPSTSTRSSAAASASTSPPTSATPPLRLFAMGDAAYERTATPDEVDAHAGHPARGDARRRGRARDQLRHHPPRRRRQAGPEPVRRPRRVRGAARGRWARSGAASWRSRRASSAASPTCTSCSRRTGVPFTYGALLTSPAGTAPACMVELNRAGWAKGAQVWPQVTPRPLKFAYTLAEPFPLNTNAEFAALMAQSAEERRAAAYADPAWRRPGRRRSGATTRASPVPRWDTYAIDESRARIPSSPAAVCSTSRPSGARRRSTPCSTSRSTSPTSALRVALRPGQRRHRRGRQAADRGALHARPVRRRRPRRPAVRRAPGHRLPGQLGARPRPHADRDGRPQADRRAGRPARPRRPRLPAAGRLGRRGRVRSRHGRPGPDVRRCATSRPTPSA